MTEGLAGHPPGFVLDSGGAVKAELGRTGLPLGLRAGDLYATDLEVALEHGDLVVLYSDGITETKLVLDEVRRFARGRAIDDDMSLVIGRITGREVAPSGP